MFLLNVGGSLTSVPIVRDIPTSEIKHTTFSVLLPCQKPNIPVAKYTSFLHLLHLDDTSSFINSLQCFDPLAYFFLVQLEFYREREN